MIHSVSLESPAAAAPTAASFQAPGLEPDAHESGLKSPAVHIRTTIGFASENSTDLSLGPGPNLKFVEFSDANPIVIEICTTRMSKLISRRFRQAGALYHTWTQL